jgi:hypothetical protein
MMLLGYAGYAGYAEYAEYAITRGAVGGSSDLEGSGYDYG